MVVTDPETLEACRRGEPDAFRVLFEQYKDRVYSIALRYAGDAATAMDITQDTFVKLYSRLGDFRGEASFDSWLYRMVVNSCMDHRRRLRRLVPLLDEVVERLFSPSAGAQEAMEKTEMERRMRRAIDALPADLRLLVVLHYTEGLAYEQIAEAVGCKVGTVGSRLNRARRLLEKRLSRE
jgi:RNA polymerase sigma-70 factor (ECF subfamily)